MLSFGRRQQILAVYWYLAPLYYNFSRPSTLVALFVFDAVLPWSSSRLEMNFACAVTMQGLDGKQTQQTQHRREEKK